MKSFRSASVCTLLMMGIAGSICGQTSAPRRGARPVFGGPELVKETTRVSVDSAGEQANFTSLGPSISSDGRFVTFQSLATNLVLPDPNSGGGLDFDVFVHDRASGATTRVSVDSAGEQGNGDSFGASISLDGRFVAFGSLATNLVASDTNVDADVFVHDRARRTTTRVSVDSVGVEGDGNSSSPSISANGRYVAFLSQATNLVPRDTNLIHDIFVHDRILATTTRVSVDSNGAQANFVSLSPRISADGRFVVFASLATNLVPRDTNGSHDVFVHDRVLATTTRVSVDSAGVQGNSTSLSPSISSDGRFVSFRSFASNLVPLDTNNTSDVFVHDRESGTTTRVSVSSAGAQADAHSSLSSISSDGRYVAFESFASNLVPSDRNEIHDIFVHDRATGITKRVSVNSHGTEGNRDSFAPSISSDGHHVAFGSFANNLVVPDMNFDGDIFVR